MNGVPVPIERLKKGFGQPMVEHERTQPEAHEHSLHDVLGTLAASQNENRGLEVFESGSHLALRFLSRADGFPSQVSGIATAASILAMRFRDGRAPGRTRQFIADLVQQTANYRYFHNEPLRKLLGIFPESVDVCAC